MAKVEVIRYAPKGLKSKQLLDVVEFYGFTNDSLLLNYSAENPEAWEVKIIIKKVKSNGQSAN